MKNDAVLSLHLNPATCGVAKFNVALARRLRLPCMPLASLCAYPLVSVKWAELGAGAPILYGTGERPFDLFMHDAPDDRAAFYVKYAWRLYVANPVIARAVRDVRPDVIEAFCPATVDGDASRGKYRVLVFGMAHKRLREHFLKLRATLDAEHDDYTIELSTAVHEGNPWDASMETSTRDMRAIFGHKLRILGYLGDDALAKELHDVDAVAAFFHPALRANNTSAWAALAAGKRLYTNVDADSPELDVSRYSWDRLLEVLR